MNENLKYLSQIKMEDRYHSKWKSIINVMKSLNLKLSKIAQHGSRARRIHRPNSDIDVIFCVLGNPNRQNFYPKLMIVLKNNFPYEKIYAGTHYNVLHLDFTNGGKFDLVLLTENEFNREYNDDLNYKRRNL